MPPAPATLSTDLPLGHPAPDGPGPVAVAGFAAALVAIVAAAVALGTVLHGRQRLAPPNVEAQATRACEQFVRAQLPAPESARFTAVIATPGPAGWSVVGAVGSGYFACRTHSDGHGAWYDDGTTVGQG